MAGCVFCAIVAGSVPAFRVTDIPDGVAFLDTRPVFHGHVLVVPREHHETLGDLPGPSIAGYFTLVRRIALAVEAGLAAGGTFVAVNNRVSQSVPHLHIHVVPRRPKDGLKGFFWPRGKYRDQAEMDAVRERLRAAVAAIKR